MLHIVAKGFHNAIAKAAVIFNVGPVIKVLPLLRVGAVKGPQVVPNLVEIEPGSSQQIYQSTCYQIDLGDSAGPISLMKHHAVQSDVEKRLLEFPIVL